MSQEIYFSLTEKIKHKPLVKRVIGTFLSESNYLVKHPEKMTEVVKTMFGSEFDKLSQDDKGVLVKFYIKYPDMLKNSGQEEEYELVLSKIVSNDLALAKLEEEVDELSKRTNYRYHSNEYKDSCEKYNKLNDKSIEVYGDDENNYICTDGIKTELKEAKGKRDSIFGYLKNIQDKRYKLALNLFKNLEDLSKDHCTFIDKIIRIPEIPDEEFKEYSFYEAKMKSLKSRSNNVIWGNNNNKNNFSDGKNKENDIQEAK